jgi:hypothetical protein
MVLEKYKMLYEMKWVKLAHPGSIISPEGQGRDGNGLPARQWAGQRTVTAPPQLHSGAQAQHRQPLPRTGSAVRE